MVLIKQEDCLKVSIPEIDSQHETMIGLINLLHENMLQGADNASLERLLMQLLEHTREHFAYEQRLMSQYNYPGYKAHKSNHDSLMRHLQELFGRYKNGDLLLSFAVVLELRRWAMLHIEKFDMPLGAFLNNRKEENATPG